MKNNTDKYIILAVVLAAAGFFLLFRRKPKKTLTGSVEVSPDVKIEAADYPTPGSIFKAAPSDPSWVNPTIWENDIYSNPNVNFPEPQTYTTPKADTATVEALKAALNPVYLKPVPEVAPVPEMTVSSYLDTYNTQAVETGQELIRPTMFNVLKIGNELQSLNNQPVIDPAPVYNYGGGGYSEPSRDSSVYKEDILISDQQTNFLQNELAY